MHALGRAARAVVATVVVVAFAGCTSPDSGPDTTPTAAPLDAGVLRAALLQPKDLGATWEVVTQARPTPLVAVCGGGEEAPPVPGSPTVVSQPLTEAGSKGAQTLDQVALVYPDAAAATAALTALRVSAEACATSIEVPARATPERNEPSYTEKLTLTPLSEGEWSGFVVERHKLYDPAHPAAADTAVVVLGMRNVVLFDAYGVYVLGAKTAAPQFGTDWRKLVGTTVRRVAA